MHLPQVCRYSSSCLQGLHQKGPESTQTTCRPSGIGGVCQAETCTSAAIACPIWRSDLRCRPSRSQALLGSWMGLPRAGNALGISRVVMDGSGFRGAPIRTLKLTTMHLDFVGACSSDHFRRVPGRALLAPKLIKCKLRSSCELSKNAASPIIALCFNLGLKRCLQASTAGR